MMTNRWIVLKLSYDDDDDNYELSHYIQNDFEKVMDL